MDSRFERGRDLQEMQVSLNMFSGAMDNLLRLTTQVDAVLRLHAPQCDRCGLEASKPGHCLGSDLECHVCIQQYEYDDWGYSPYPCDTVEALGVDIAVASKSDGG